MAKPDVQIYSNYTAEDFRVWEALFNRQMAILEKQASQPFLEAVGQVGFRYNKIPDFIETNALLANATGWHILTVPGLCPPVYFFDYLSQKKFTATCWLRKYSQLDYIEEPDMFHDVFGHVPLLSNREYCAFFQKLGELAHANLHNEEVIKQIERLYWFTIEFGLMSENDGLKIYGAGIISSHGETLNALGNTSKKYPFKLDAVINHDFRNDIIQPEYYVIESFNQLTEALTDFEKQINARCKQ